MERKQFFTTCKYCGRQILMTRNGQTGKWIPCNPVVEWFTPSGGPETFIDEYGKTCRGYRSGTGEIGYRRHTTCKAVKTA